MEHPANNDTLTLTDFVIYASLFVIIVWGFELIPSQWLERLYAQLTSDLLSSTGLSSSWTMEGGQAHLTLAAGIRDVSTTIIRECTGIHVFAIFSGLILPLKGGLWLRKALSIVVSGSLLFIMNLSRLMLTVVLTAFDVPPFSWIFTNPTVETYHYPLSFAYGLLGVAVLVVITVKWTLPELGNTLLNIPRVLWISIQTSSRHLREASVRPAGQQ